MGATAVGDGPGRILLVGTGDVTTALTAMTRVLGWDPVVAADAATAKQAIDTFGERDSIVVLSHDDGVDGPVLAAALDSDAGHIAAMGSRRTQRRRQEWLRGNGVSDESIAAIRGPAGLDLGAATPAEIAVSIIAVRRGAYEGIRLSTRAAATPAERSESVCPGG